jgi:hypothetical protein
MTIITIFPQLLWKRYDEVIVVTVILFLFLSPTLHV